MSALSNTAPPPYFEAPPAYSEHGEDLAAQVEQMKVAMEKMRLERDEMMWKMHLEKEAMMEKMEMMRLEKEALTKQGHSVSSQMRIQTEMKEFIAKEKHWSSDFDSWDKNSTLPAHIRSFVDTFLKTIPTETVYAIHSIIVKSYGKRGQDGIMYAPNGPSRLKLYIATDSKVYTVDIYGDIIKDRSGDINKDILNCIMYPGYVFKAIVTFPSEPNPTFWRAVFSQMGQGEIQFSVVGEEGYELYTNAIAKLEALFKSFR
jgi:hypothetical protein